MFEFFILDEYTAIGEFIDENGNNSWQMIKTNSPIKNNIINAGDGFTIKEIDLNKVEWNGKLYKIEVTKQYKKLD